MNTLLLFVLLFQLGYHCGISQGRGIPKGVAIGDVAQKSPHNFTAPGLWELNGKEDLVGPGNRTDLLRRMAFQLVYQSGRILNPRLERDKGTDRLPFDPSRASGSW